MNNTIILKHFGTKLERFVLIIPKVLIESTIFLYFLTTTEEREPVQRTKKKVKYRDKTAKVNLKVNLYRP